MPTFTELQLLDPSCVESFSQRECIVTFIERDAGFSLFHGSELVEGRVQKSTTGTYSVQNTHTIPTVYAPHIGTMLYKRLASFTRFSLVLFSMTRPAKRQNKQQEFWMVTQHMCARHVARCTISLSAIYTTFCITHSLYIYIVYIFLHPIVIKQFSTRIEKLWIIGSDCNVYCSLKHSQKFATYK